MELNPDSGIRYLGISKGALAKAAKYTVKNTRPWPFAGDIKSKATDEFYIQSIYGDLQAKVWGVEAQLNHVGELLKGLIERSIEDRSKLSANERGEVAVRVAAGKVVAIDVGLEVTSRYVLCKTKDP